MWPCDWGRNASGEMHLQSGVLRIREVKVSTSDETPGTLVAQFWGKRVSKIRKLPSYDDENWKIVCDDGSYVLKVTMGHAECRGGIDSEATMRALDCECRMMNAISACADVTSPRILRSLSGKEIERFGDKFLRLIDFVEDPPLSSCRRPNRPRSVSERLGEALAQSAAALASVKPEERPLAWDLRNVSESSSSLLPHLDEEKASAVTRALRRLEENVDFARLPNVQLIHGDSNDENIFIGEKIITLIDFGDFLKAPRVIDLAVSLAYVLFGDDDEWLEEACVIVAAYHKISPLTSLELDSLFPLVAARNCQTVLNAAARISADPDDAYVAISAEPAWNLLKAIDSKPLDTINAALKRACFGNSDDSEQVPSLKAASNNHPLPESRASDLPPSFPPPPPPERKPRRSVLSIVTATIAAASLAAVSIALSRRRRGG